jgi:hypothetical protein
MELPTHRRAVLADWLDRAFVVVLVAVAAVVVGRLRALDVMAMTFAVAVRAVVAVVACPLVVPCTRLQEQFMIHVRAQICKMQKSNGPVYQLADDRSFRIAPKRAAHRRVAHVSDRTQTPNSTRHMHV